MNLELNTQIAILLLLQILIQGVIFCVLIPRGLWKEVVSLFKFERENKKEEN